MNTIAIGTRFFGKDADKDLPRIAAFLDAAQKIGPVYVAVHTDADTIGSLDFIKDQYPEVHAFAVMPWQKFVPALNAIAHKAVVAGCDQLLLASAEFPPLNEQVGALTAHLDVHTLVAGARFSEHQFSEGEVVGTGVTVPWNTFGLWNLNLLARTGFPLVGDASFDVTQAGVEEVACIALLQSLYGYEQCIAKLISVPGFYEEWNMNGWDTERVQKHKAKIASKVGRPAMQLEWAHLPTPRVLHIV